VLPFVDLTADSARALLGDDITAAVIARLTAVPELKVISRTSAMRYKGSSAALGAIASELAVANVVEGSVRREAGRLRVAVRLVDARADRPVWAGTFDLEPRDPFGVQQEIATQVVRALGVTLADGDRVQFARRGTASAEAEELYRRGRYHWERRTTPDHLKAMEYFGRAIALDSGYADAYAGLADAYLTAYQLNLAPLPEAEAYARHKWAAERALALDDRSGAAHVSFAISLWWQRNWPGAERELRRAIELRPGSAHTHYWYALLLGGQGRLDEAMRETRVAAALDPFAVVSQVNYGWACELAGRHECAIEGRTRAVELSPAWGSTHQGLGNAYSYAGRHADAERELRLGMALQPEKAEIVADLASALARAGRPAEARRELSRARAHAAPPISMARAYVALGEADSAFAWLDRTSWTWPHRATRTDPGLAPLRADPRYARLWARVDREMGLR
jgi:TolB-like protein/Flp pilus assembly protein TadD